MRKIPHKQLEIDAAIQQVEPTCWPSPTFASSQKNKTQQKEKGKESGDEMKV